MGTAPLLWWRSFNTSERPLYVQLEYTAGTQQQEKKAPSLPFGKVEQLQFTDLSNVGLATLLTRVTECRKYQLGKVGDAWPKKQPKKDKGQGEEANRLVAKPIAEFTIEKKKHKTHDATKGLRHQSYQFHETVHKCSKSNKQSQTVEPR